MKDDEGKTELVKGRRVPEQDPVHALGLWLAQGGDGIPRQATGLRLVNKSEDEQVLTYWDLDYVRENLERGLPETILGILQASCDDSGRPSVFWVQYVRGPEQAPWITRRIRLRPSDWSDARDFDGSTQNQIVQQQRHAEALSQALIQMSGKVTHHSDTIVMLLMEDNKRKTDENAKLRAKNERLQNELHEVRECLMALEAEVESGAAGDIDPKDMIEKIVKAVGAAKEMAGVVGMMTGAAAPKLNGVPNGKAHA